MDENGKAGRPLEAPLCKWIVAVLIRGTRPSDALRAGLETTFGPIDYVGDFLPFDGTDYYEAEFGPGLHRGFLSFRGVGGPEDLAARKHEAARLEARFSEAGKRTCNLDVGYLDADKLVLASFKPGPLKLYLKDGVYADLLVHYANARFDPLPWAFPDFRDGRYFRSLGVIREKLKSDLRKSRAEPGPSP